MMPKPATERCTTCEDIAELTAEIQASSEVALVVLNDLLQYDKIEMGKLNIEVSVVMMWKTIKDVVQSFKIDAANKGVTLSMLFESMTKTTPPLDRSCCCGCTSWGTASASRRR
jgi:signal transduction histidine kinase